VESEITIRCSFCQRPAPEVNKLIAGPGIYICDQCVNLCNDILAQESQASDADTPQIPSWHSLTDADLLAKLPRIASVGAQVEGGLQRWVREARRRGSSWADIGEALGMSRQSAWERFSHDENEAA
jgi:ClpX C4-type zinc finger